jgi:hypothetical protein
MNSRRGARGSDLSLAEFQERRRKQQAGRGATARDVPRALSNEAKMEYAEEEQRWMTAE